MSQTIITVTLDGNKIDSAVAGSDLSVKGYAMAICSVIRGVSDMFAKESGIEEGRILDVVLQTINEEVRTAGYTSESATKQ